MKIDGLLNEEVGFCDGCAWCKESELEVGKSSDYGAIVVYKADGWFATLSPRTGGGEYDFTLQLMPEKHLTHFAQIEKLGAGYGKAFAALSKVMTELLAEDGFSASAMTKEKGTAVAVWGKCTTWKEKKEHLHIKLYPFRNDLSQPCVVDSSFGRKQVFNEVGEEFVKMKPIRKKMLDVTRLKSIADKIIALLNQTTQ